MLALRLGGLRELKAETVFKTDTTRTKQDGADRSRVTIILSIRRLEAGADQKTIELEEVEVGN